SEGLGSDYVRILYETKDRVLWIGTREGLYQLKRGFLSSVQTNVLAAGATIRALDEDAEGNLWIGTDRGLVRWKNGNGTLFSALTQEGMLNDAVRALWRDGEGNLWIGSNDGLTRLRDGVFTNYGKKDKWVNAIFQDSRSNLWVGSYNGLSRFQEGQSIPELNNEGMSFDNVNAIIEDEEGNIWVGCKDGLSRLRLKPFRSYAEQEGLTHYNVMSVFEDVSGSMWAGTWGGGLHELKDGKFVPHVVKDTLESTLILALHQGRQGDFWIGMDFDGGLYHYQNGESVRYGKDQGLVGSAVKVIHEDRQKNLWIGTRNALNLFKDGKFTSYTTNEGLAGNMVKAILEDHAGAIWFGTDGGLSKWNDGKFISFTSNEGLSENKIAAIYEDADHVLWIGTEGGGLNCFRNGKFYSYTTKQGLFSDDVFEILETDRGYFWMTCQEGIFRCLKKDFADFDSGKIKTITSISYDKADGLVSTVCNSVAKPAAWKARDGRLWFATTKGLVAIDPNSNVPINRAPPPVFIEKIIADKKETNESSREDANEKYSWRDSSIHALTIPAGRGELEFHYTALSFQAPEKNRFKYKLHGEDLDWVDAGARREAYYNNIRPGRYVFQVLACNNDGFWNETGASLAFVILPHFWETWWFKALVLTAVALLFVLVYRTRIGQVRQMERLRLRLAADLHDEVGSNLGSISLLSLMMQQQELTPAEARKDLALIHRISGQTANSIKDIVWFTNPEYDTMQDLLLRMKDVANTLLPGLNCDFQSNVENPARKLSLDFRQNIFLMFKEILANILKHSGANRVEITISEKEKIWKLNIKDNGAGFDSTQLSQGNGLKNLRRRAATLKGVLKIETQPGHGTSILFFTEYK
ncbi:MAG: two-component regulator propeller domain-containing protein, partial [Verrucomicrobiota bacterium]